METIYTMIARLYTGMYERDESEDVGAGFVEYALLVSLIALAAFVGLNAFGGRVNSFFSDLATRF